MQMTWASPDRAPAPRGVPKPETPNALRRGRSGRVRRDTKRPRQEPLLLRVGRAVIDRAGLLQLLLLLDLLQLLLQLLPPLALFLEELPSALGAALPGVYLLPHVEVGGQECDAQDDDYECH